MPSNQVAENTEPYPPSPIFLILSSLSYLIWNPFNHRLIFSNSKLKSFYAIVNILFLLVHP
ncbi:hypothetical protein C2G38_1729849 [Gigaspora rosea]|uniref:Uncharacterized protein n=1 Tax=Gigaspora rosea TaxID=44941 RepID=A0A397W5S3_9GLOM|nr:hypothetical protein C2G38_1729849 [Gigaspora rosea]